MKKYLHWNSFLLIVFFFSLLIINFIACEDGPIPCGCGPCRGQEDYYIGNINTNVFHRPCCSYLPYPENQIRLETREEAINKGYRPCEHCNP